MLEIMSSDVLFCLTSSPNPNEIQFAMMKNTAIPLIRAAGTRQLLAFFPFFFYLTDD